MTLEYHLRHGCRPITYMVRIRNLIHGSHWRVFIVGIYITCHIRWRLTLNPQCFLNLAHTYFTLLSFTYLNLFTCLLHFNLFSNWKHTTTLAHCCYYSLTLSISNISITFLNDLFALPQESKAIDPCGHVNPQFIKYTLLWLNSSTSPTPSSTSSSEGALETIKVEKKKRKQGSIEIDWR